MQLKSLCKQRSFFTNASQSSEDSVKASFAIISEMIAKSSSRPYHDKGFLGYSLLQGLLQCLEVHTYANNFSHI